MWQWARSHLNPSAGPVTADTITRCAIWVSSSLRGAIQRVAGRKNVAEHHWRARAPCHTKPATADGPGQQEDPYCHVFRRTLVEVGEKIKLTSPWYIDLGLVANPEIAVRSLWHERR